MIEDNCFSCCSGDKSANDGLVVDKIFNEVKYVNDDINEKDIEMIKEIIEPTQENFCLRRIPRPTIDSVGNGVTVPSHRDQFI